MPVVTLLMSGRGDGIPSTPTTSARHPSLMLLGVGTLLPLLIQLMGA